MFYKTAAQNRFTQDFSGWLAMIKPAGSKKPPLFFPLGL
jgi:hypothetical protein